MIIDGWRVGGLENPLFHGVFQKIAEVFCEKKAQQNTCQQLFLYHGSLLLGAPSHFNACKLYLCNFQNIGSEYLMEYQGSLFHTIESFFMIMVYQHVELNFVELQAFSNIHVLWMHQDNNCSLCKKACVIFTENSHKIQTIEFKK